MSILETLTANLSRADRRRVQSLNTKYHRFNPPHLLTEYQAKPGPHNGHALPAAGYAAIATQKTKGGSWPLVVIGEWVREDGVRFLDLGVPWAWINEQRAPR